MATINTWKEVQSRGRRTVARLARRILPRSTIRLAHVEPGVTLRVSLRRHVMFWSKGLAKFEPSSVKAIKAAIFQGDHVLDVGANVGFFSTLLSRWAGDDGRVLAVEPEVENRKFLRANLDANGCSNVTICECAVGASAGDADFSIDEATGATGRLGSALTASELAVGTGRLQVVRTRVETIDSLCERHQIVPAFMKIDIEGDEISALEGGMQTLRTARPVIVSEVTGIGAGEVIALLLAENYRIWDLDSSQVVGSDDRPFMIIAIPAEQEQGTRAERIKRAIGIASS